MPANAIGRIVLSTLLTSVAALPALAQPVQDTSQPESSALTWFLLAFCVLIVALLAHTARRMATLK
ncbi:MAG TPA: hypothetical protein VL173_01155 [Vicinamibacterales bacterium]|jgi:hypothetical protein|nr:hypothetical protein [Vicinamibacterales bacterium]